MSRAHHGIAAAISALTATLLAATLLVASPAGADAARATDVAAASKATAGLTNLAHLNALTTRVTPPSQPGHTTYRLDREHAVTELWVYANHETDGTYQPTGGGTFDPATNTYGQGAYDADDVARAAVVYLRHWRLDHDAFSRTQAFEMLRGLTYLQTAAGPDAGNVVLWMQPDGTLHPSPTPVELPDPSDSGASYWLARTIWALGEGYADFRHADPGFAGFLAQRMNLALGALHREVLTRYGQYHVVNGHRTPAWLIVDGSDASAEAVLGLSAFVRAGGSRAARVALAELARGIADLGAGNVRQWPYGAILPSAVSLSQWHAWAAQMPAALAAASIALHDRRLLAPAVADAALFTPQLLAATGPDNALSPAPVDGSQIAYGADARVESLNAVGAAAHSTGISDLAGIAAGWFFGQNPSGQAMYDPATGVTFDGVSAEGTVNLNSGAESTIHGLLSMLTLDAHPALARLALGSAHVVLRDGQQVVEAESATLGGNATVIVADPVEPGLAPWSGGAYVEVGTGSRLTWTLPASAQARIVEPIVDRVIGPAGRTRFTTHGSVLGVVGYGGAGPQGQSAAPTTRLPVQLARTFPAGATTLSARTVDGAGRLDALLVTPVVSQLSLSGAGRTTVLLSSRAGQRQVRAVAVPGSGLVTVAGYDRHGRLVAISHARAGSVLAPIAPGGFTVVTG